MRIELMFFGISFVKLFFVKFKCCKFVMLLIVEGRFFQKLFLGKRYLIIVGKYNLNLFGSVLFNLVSERCIKCRDDKLNRFLKFFCKFLVVLRFKNQSFFNLLMFFGILLCKVFLLRLSICSFDKFLMFLGIFLESLFFIWQ